MPPLSMERSSRASGATVLTVIGLALGALVFLPEYLPFSDHPQHVAQQALWLTFRDPALHEPGRYEVNLSTPYALPAVAAHLAARVVGPELGVRIVLWAALVAFVLGASALLHAYGRPLELALAALPAALSWSFYWGFFPFVVALPLALFGVAAARRVAFGGARRDAALLALLSLAAVAAHGFAFLLLAAFGLLTAIGAPRGAFLRRAGRIMGALAPALVAFGVSAWRLSGGGPTEVVFGALKFRFQHALASVFGAHSGDPRVLLLTCGAALIALLLRRATRGVPLAGDEPGRRDLRWLALAGVAGFALFPHELGFTWALYERIPPIGWVAFVGSWPVPVAPTARRRWALAFAGLAAGSIASAGIQVARGSREAAGFRELSSGLPPGQRILWSSCGDEIGNAVPVPVYRHFASYYQIARGGELSRTFAHYPHMVVRYADPSLRVEPGPVHPERYDLLIARAGPLCSLEELVARGPVAVRGRYVALPASAVDEVLRARLWRPGGEERVVTKTW